MRWRSTPEVHAFGVFFLRCEALPTSQRLPFEPVQVAANIPGGVRSDSAAPQAPGPTHRGRTVLFGWPCKKPTCFRWPWSLVMTTVISSHAQGGGNMLLDGGKRLPRAFHPAGVADEDCVRLIGLALAAQMRQ